MSVIVESVITQVPVKDSRIKNAEQIILTLIGCKVICPNVFHYEIEDKIKLLETAIRLFKEDPSYKEYLAKLVRENRKFINHLLDEVEK